jgi:hypothetical protein
MNAEQMLAHLVEAMRMALGEFDATEEDADADSAVPPAVRVLAAMAEGAPTRGSCFRQAALDRGQQARARVVNVVAGVRRRRNGRIIPCLESSPRVRGGAQMQHIDHHLRQFGL